MASPSASMNSSTPVLKTHFKTPEGRYKLQYEKTHSVGIIHYSHGKSVSQVTIAYLTEKPGFLGPNSPSTPSSTSVVKGVAARLLTGVSGIKAFPFGGSVGGGKMMPGSSRSGGTFGVSARPGCSTSATNFDGNGTYLIFNAGNYLFISDLNSQNKDPIKYIHFSISNPLCHAFDSEAKDGHDLLVGLRSGDIYTVSLRQQLQDLGKKLVGAQHYNKDGEVNNSRCTCVAWVPNGEGIFISAHADGNLYVYGKIKDGAIDPSFPAIKDPTQFSVTHARSSKCNPIIRWHIFQGPINHIAFSANGFYLASVSRDGYLRVFDYYKEQLLFGGKSYYGALLCCAWSHDGKYILTGGEDDLVHVWSTQDRKIVACGEGHKSWVSGVSFDSYCSAPNQARTGENVTYRFGSVGQDTRLLLWDLEIDEISEPLRCQPPCGGSPTVSGRSRSGHWDAIPPAPGTLQPSPSIRHVAKLAPLVAQQAHIDPLSSLIFTEDSVVTICHEGHIKIWSRPVASQANSGTSLIVFPDTSTDRHQTHQEMAPDFLRN